MIVITVSKRILAPQTSLKIIFSSTRGEPTGRESVSKRITSASAIDIPIAEINVASRLVPRMRRRR